MEDNVTRNCTPIPIARPEVILAQQITVSVTCVLSILGASFIIFTYIAFKDLRTGARQLLVQLSIGDIVVAASHMFGVLYNLPKYVVDGNCGHEPQDGQGKDDLACEIQAGFTMFGVIATFLWTLAVAVYLLVIIVFEQRTIGKRLRIVFYPLCWGIPLLQVIVFGSLKYLGFDEGLDIGWCYMSWVNVSDTAQHREMVPQLFGYSLWSYLTYLLLPVLYLWIRCYVKVKLTRVHKRNPLPTKPVTQSRMYDMKLTFIPLIFLVLRLSGLGLTIPHQYLSYESRLSFRATWWNAVLVLTGGVGASAQGFVNAILFCAFTRVVRKRFISLMRRLCCCCCQGEASTKMYVLQPTPPPSDGGIHEDTTTEDDCTYPDNVLVKNRLTTNGSKYQAINNGN